MWEMKHFEGRLTCECCKLGDKKEFVSKFEGKTPQFITSSGRSACNEIFANSTAGVGGICTDHFRAQANRMSLLSEANCALRSAYSKARFLVQVFKMKYL